MLDEGKRETVFENRELREIFGHMMEDLTDEHRKLHS
jgi:hypothetical protein